VFIRACPRHPRFFFIIPQIDVFRGGQRDKQLVERTKTNHEWPSAAFGRNQNDREILQIDTDLEEEV
jgi:hypothetical protein